MTKDDAFSSICGHFLNLPEDLESSGVLTGCPGRQKAITIFTKMIPGDKSLFYITPDGKTHEETYRIKNKKIAGKTKMNKNGSRKKRSVDNDDYYQYSFVNQPPPQPSGNLEPSQITFRDFPGETEKGFRVRRSLADNHAPNNTNQGGGLVVKVEDPKFDADETEAEAEYVDDYDDSVNAEGSFEKSVDVLFNRLNTLANPNGKVPKIKQRVSRSLERPPIILERAPITHEGEGGSARLAPRSAFPQPSEPIIVSQPGPKPMPHSQVLDMASISVRREAMDDDHIKKLHNVQQALELLKHDHHTMTEEWRRLASRINTFEQARQDQLNQERMVLGQEQRDLDKQKMALKARRDQLVDHEMREAEAINLARRDLTVGAVHLKSAEVRLEQKSMEMLQERKDIDMKIMEMEKARELQLEVLRKLQEAESKTKQQQKDFAKEIELTLKDMDNIRGDLSQSKRVIEAKNADMKKKYHLLQQMSGQLLMKEKHDRDVLLNMEKDLQQRMMAEQNAEMVLHKDQDDLAKERKALEDEKGRMLELAGGIKRPPPDPSPPQPPAPPMKLKHRTGETVNAFPGPLEPPEPQEHHWPPPFVEDIKRTDLVEHDQYPVYEDVEEHETPAPELILTPPPPTTLSTLYPEGQHIIGGLRTNPGNPSIIGRKSEQASEDEASFSGVVRGDSGKLLATVKGFSEVRVYPVKRETYADGKSSKDADISEVHVNVELCNNGKIELAKPSGKSWLKQILAHSQAYFLTWELPRKIKLTFRLDKRDYLKNDKKKDAENKQVLNLVVGLDPKCNLRDFEKDNKRVTCCLCHSTLNNDFTLNVYTAHCATGDLECVPDEQEEDGCMNADGTSTDLPKATVTGSDNDLMLVYVSSKTGQEGVFNFTLHCQDLETPQVVKTARSDYFNFIKNRMGY